jgi:hypothetical protein
VSTSNLSLWINPQNNTLTGGFNSATQPPQAILTQGDDVLVDVHMIDFSGGESIEIPFPSNASIKLAIGRIDRFPTSGNFVFQYGANSVSIPVTGTIVDVNTLINSMPSIVAEGGVMVYFVNSTTYRVVFNTVGPKLDSSVNTSGLYPSSTASVTVITNGSSSLNEVQHIKLKATPIAYSETFTLAPTPSISIQELTTSIFRINITDVLKYGNFTISNGIKTTAAISWTASSFEVLSALTAAGISSTSGTVSSVQYSVTKNDNLSWDISRTNGAYQLLSVSAIGFSGFSTMTGVLNMNTIEVEDLLGGAARVAATLEVEMTSGQIKQTLYQGLINIANDLIDNASYSPIQFPTGSGISDAPQDNVLYGRKNGAWSSIILSGSNIPDYDNTVIYTVGSQVYYNGGLYRMILSGGVPDIDPALNPTHWESLSGGDLSNYVSKDGANEMTIGSSISFANTFKTTTISHNNFGIFSSNDIDFSTLSELGLQVTDANGSTQVSASGIFFPDSTIQTTAASPFDPTGYATETFVTSQGYLVSSSLTGYATQSFVASNYASLNHSHSVFYLQGWGGGQNPQYIQSGSVLRVYNADDTSAFLVPREVSRRKLIKSSLPPPSIIVQNTYYANTSGVNGSMSWEITQIVTFSFSTNVLRLNTGRIDTFGISGTGQDTHYWTLGTNISPQASERQIGGYNENFGDILSINLEAFPSGSPSSGRYNGSYTADGVTVSWETTANTVDQTSSPTNFAMEGGQVYPPNCSTGINFLQSEDVQNSYIEPVMKGGVLGEMTQELVGANSFSYTYNNSISKYSLIYDQSENKWSLAEALDNSIIAKTTGATFTGKLTTAPSQITVENGGSSFVAGFRIPPALGTPTYPLTGDIWLSSGGILNYMSNTTIASLPVTQLTNTFSAPQIIDTTSTTLAGLRLTQKGTAPALVIEDGTPATPDTSAFVVNANGAVGIQVNPATWTPATGVVFDVTGKSVLNPTNINTPSLNLGATASASSPASAINGDVWITNVASPKLAYRTGGVNYYPAVANQFNTFTAGMAITGASVSSPQLAVTQTGQGVAVQITTQIGSGHALVVEDITSPDTSATVVNSAGAVGVGVDPANWTPTNKVEVVGAVKADSITFDGTAQFKVNSVQTHGSGNSHTHDIFISFNGSTYRIPMIFVSTP